MAGLGRELGFEVLGCDGKQHVSGCCHAPNLLHKGGIDGWERDGYIVVLCFGRWKREKNLGGGVHLLSSHTEHTLVYVSTTQEQGHVVCRRDVETKVGVCVGRNESKRRGQMECCVLCVCISFLSFSCCTTRFAP